MSKIAIGKLPMLMPQGLLGPIHAAYATPHSSRPDIPKRSSSMGFNRSTLSRRPQVVNLPIAENPLSEPRVIAPQEVESTIAEVIEPEPAGGEKPVTPPPVGPIQAAKAELESYFNEMPFESGLTPEEIQEQPSLQASYIDWASERVATLREALPGYQPGVDMLPNFAEGSLSACFEAMLAFFSSATRSPTRNAAVTGISLSSHVPAGTVLKSQRGELAFAIDAITAGGGYAALASLSAEKVLLAAMNEEAKHRDVPTMPAVDKALLSPVRPAGVPLLVVRTGADGRRRKQFYANTPGAGRSGMGDLPTQGQLCTQAKDAQWWVSFRQTLLDEKHLGGWINPLMTGGTNLSRRLWSTENTLSEAWKVFLTSALASGTASGATKFVVNAAKVTPYVGQVKVDDLLGGTQWLNLYVPESRGKGNVVSTWSDIKGLPSAALGAARRAGSLATEMFRHKPYALMADFGFRHLLPNVTVSIAAPGFAGLVAQGAREGKFDPLPGESIHSNGNIIQQVGQSLFNELNWKLMQGQMAQLKCDLVSIRSARLSAKLGKLQDDRADGLKRVTDIRQSGISTLDGRIEEGDSPMASEAVRLLFNEPELQAPAEIIEMIVRSKQVLSELIPNGAAASEFVTAVTCLTDELKRIVAIDKQFGKVTRQLLRD